MLPIIPLMSMLAMPVAAAGTTGAATAAAPSPTLLRASLLVEDAERAAAFYAALGFRIESDFTNARRPEGNPFPLNAPSTAVRLVILASADGAGGRIGLVEFRSPTPDENRLDKEKTGRSFLCRDGSRRASATGTPPARCVRLRRPRWRGSRAARRSRAR